MNGKPVEPPELENRSNSIVYSYWDGESWSVPIDVFYSSSGSAFNYPYAAIDDADTLHLVWQSYQGIYYSSVPLSEAKWVKAWQPPKIIARARGDGSRIYASSHWGLQVIYPAWDIVESGSHDGNIYYIRSQDQGDTWSNPIKLSSLGEFENANSSHPSVVEDHQGSLHALWFKSEAPDWRGSVVYYSRSEDGGMNWSKPDEMGRRTGEERWASMPEIYASDGDELHITWVCGIDAHRCHRWSKDGGAHWSNPTREFGDMLSLAGWDTLVSDGSGQLYWIMQLRYPGALYYSYWTGREWSGLNIVNDGLLAGGHYLRAVARNGNQIDLVIVQQDEKEIWHMVGVTSAKPIEPASRSTIEIKATTSPDLSVDNINDGYLASKSETAATPELSPPALGIIDPDDSPTGKILTISILPVMAIILVTILSKSIIHRPKSGGKS